MTTGEGMVIKKYKRGGRSNGKVLGSVQYRTSLVPGTCGISIIYSLSVQANNPETTEQQNAMKSEIYSLFMEDIKRREFTNNEMGGEGRDSYVARTAKVLMTDRQGGNIYKFMQQEGEDWFVGEPLDNPKTGHPLRVYEYNLPPYENEH